MKLLPLLLAAGASAVFGSTTALAQDRGGHYSGGHSSDGHYSGGHSSGGHYSGGHWGGYGLRAYPRYYYPYSYAWPFYGYYPYYSYSYPLYAAAPPTYVERYYVEPAPEPVQPATPQYRYEERSERSYAQITPPAQPAPAPRFERYSLSARELFGFDQAKLRLPQPKLDEIASVLKRNPQIASVRITGYTDRIGTEAYNMKLSQRRANAVKDYLVGKGVEAKRLTALGRGESNPVVHCNDRDQAALIKCLEPNRRVEVEEITVERKLP